MKRNIIFLLIIICIVFAFLSPIIVQSRARHYANSDFFSYWLAAKMAMLNQNPYNQELWVNGHITYGATWVGFNTFLYPPVLSVILKPIALLPIYNAFVVWTFLSLTSFFSAMILLLSCWIDSTDKLKYIIPITAGAFLFRPFLVTLIHGQIGAFLLLIIVLAVLCLESRKMYLGGFLIGLIMLKPNIGLLIVILVSIWVLFKKMWLYFAGLLSSAILMFLISQISLPGWINQYYSVLISKGDQILGLNPTLWGVAGLICNYNQVCTFRIGILMSILILLIVIVFIVYNRHSLTARIVFSISISTTLLLTPYAWAYDQILLLLPIIVFSLWLKELGKSYLLITSFPILFSLLSIVLAFVGTYLLRDTASTLLSLLMFGTMIWISIKDAGDRKLDAIYHKL
jgi:hypothetical protein